MKMKSGLEKNIFEIPPEMKLYAKHFTYTPFWQVKEKLDF